ncbi:hypothetical protein H257_12437 [Aphanomyces astaci]|uniref:C3H1-type domain-containing protein n=1 Tax=Aphanomyces astaci TaxID=112090 RepID=W4G0Z3_APHAT|nr:hypothetical protein H257_12437 [Aphanomyces astaci]ETV72704.1 hypothetical protein H257_12437 [Aphanomyces astaci]|eukprot:XP_009837932.1 hypothetical protein H257_12437 [Aphanomyces astaci]
MDALFDGAAALTATMASPAPATSAAESQHHTPQCFFNGCSHPARPGSVKCAFHRKKGTCMGPGCRNQVYARGRCVLHGARKPCTHPGGCNGFARSRGLCSRHSRGADEGTSSPDRVSGGKSLAPPRTRHTSRSSSSAQHCKISPTTQVLLTQVDPKARSCLDALLQLHGQHPSVASSTPRHYRSVAPLLPLRDVPFAYTPNLPKLPSIHTWFAPCIM